MNRGFSRRGQPLLALVMVLCCWVSARAMMWEPKAAPHIDPIFGKGPMFASGTLRGLEDAFRPEDEPAQVAEADLVSQPAPMSYPGMAGTERQALTDTPGEAHSAPHGNFAPLPAEPRAAMPRSEEDPSAPLLLPPSPAAPPVPSNVAIGHNLLWMAALTRVPMPASLAAVMDEGRGLAAASTAPATPAAQPGPKRWSADGWILWRRGSVAPIAGALLTPSYGASQAGAVIRYRLAPSSALRPAVYLRTTAALNGTSEREAALGLQLRPIRGLPLSLAGEARVTAIPGRTIVRPAVFAFTELPPFALPLGMRGEFYGQGGYVGGSQSTAFADGQLRLDRRLLPIGRADLRLGGGVWGGIQKGASRVDAGPTLGIGRGLGGSGSMRLTADWRFRVAGKAAPGSGPAVTLSAGF